MERERFEALVEEAVDSLPRKFKDHLENIAVMVEDTPPRRRSSAARSTLLGLYHGVPLPYRGPYYGNVPPDVIIIFKQPIEAMCSSDEEIRKVVRDTVIHEIGHALGMSEKRVRDNED
jgi:predicted Zn-dependent protease with MMP-like domain